MDRVLYLTQLSELTLLPPRIPIDVQLQLAAEAPIEHSAADPYYAILRYKQERGVQLNTRELNSLAWHELFIQWLIRHKTKIERVKLTISILVQTAVIGDGLKFSTVLTTVSCVALRRPISDLSDEVSQLQDAVHSIGYAARLLSLDEQTVLAAMGEACREEVERCKVTFALVCVFRTLVCISRR